MNSHTLSLILATGIIGVFSLFATNPALGIEPPPDNAKPPAELENRAEEPDNIAAKLPFIGVVTAVLPEMVADHVNLKPGTGIIVQTVMPKSPAELAGIKTNDIILKINETDVNDPETFSAEIRSMKIGDKLKLKAIQKGKPADLEATLAERPANAFADFQNRELLLDGNQNGQALELNLGGIIEGALGIDGIEEMIIPDILADERLQKMLRGRKGAAPEDAPQIQPGAENNFQLNAQSTIRMMDDKGSVEFKSIGESTEVTVRDKANKIVWSGPWDTDQDKAAAPDDVRPRIDRLNLKNGGGLKFQFGR